MGGGVTSTVYIQMHKEEKRNLKRITIEKEWIMIVNCEMKKQESQSVPSCFKVCCQMQVSFSKSYCIADFGT